MTVRASFKQSDVTRLVRGAIKGGLPANSFRVTVIDGHPTLLPIAANAPSDAAQDAEQRMKDAFGE